MVSDRSDRPLDSHWTAVFSLGSHHSTTADVGSNVGADVASGVTVGGGISPYRSISLSDVGPKPLLNICATCASKLADEGSISSNESSSSSGSSSDE